MRREYDGRVEYDDVAYPDFGVIVHLDGRTHRYAVRFRDMRRDNAAVVRGEDPLRYGWFDIDERPCDVAAQIVLLLARNGWSRQPRRCGSSCSLARLLPCSPRSRRLDHWQLGAAIRPRSPVIMLTRGLCCRAVAEGAGGGRHR
jgi:hypothetical protein